MKIAMFTDAYYPRINGVAVSVRSYAAELCKIGHEVCVVCLEYPQDGLDSSFLDEKKDEAKIPFKVIRIPSLPVVFSKEDRMVRFEKWNFFKSKVDEFKPDVIHINSEWTVGYFAAIYARRRHLPMVYTFHTMWEDYLMNYVNFLPVKSLRKIGVDVVKHYLKRADVIIAPTRRIAEVVERYGVKKEVDILPTGIPDGQFKFSVLRSKVVLSRLYSKFPLLKGKKVLLFVGRIVKEKNVDLLFDVLERVQKTNKKTALLFVGGGPYLEELKALAKERGLESSVFFTGYISGDDVVYFYKLASVFVFPSKTETQGLVTVEAMISGLPVVAVGELGTKDIMKGDNGGFMVSDDADEFAGKVSLLLKDKNLHKQKSIEAQEWGRQWNISNLTPRLVACYEKAAANHKNGQNINE